MITLITGSTGSGKTALAVSMMLENKGRPIFSMGIPELKVDHFPVPPVSEWVEMRPSEEDPSITLPYYRFPSGSLIFLDEAQRVFRPRMAGAKVPPEVQAYETHRHTGVDFVLLTQHPKLLDVNIQRLVKRHIHIEESYRGRMIFEWNKARDPDSRADREVAAKVKYKLPKHVFSLYKSAEEHTKTKLRVPFFVYVFWGALAASLAIFLYIGYGAFTKTSKGSQKLDAVKHPGEADAFTVPAQAAASGDAKSLSAGAYIAHWQPRIEGQPHSAPAYDEVTKPTDAPVPSLCLDSRKNGCRCWTQQHTRYQTTQEQCRIIVRDGFYIPWKKEEPRAPEPQRLPESKPQSLLAAAAGQGAADRD